MSDLDNISTSASKCLCCFALLMFLIFALKVDDICMCLVLHEININKLTVY